MKERREEELDPMLCANYIAAQDNRISALESKIKKLTAEVKFYKDTFRNYGIKVKHGE